MSLEITPAPVVIPDELLADLGQRLRTTRWPDRATAPGWEQGIPLEYVQELCTYWRTQYDWRRWESELNSFSPARATIDGLGIHFLHVRSPHANALPLIMTHGWPGSVAEFRKVIGPLTRPTAFGAAAQDAFHVICPALPGYGFSDKPVKTGWGAEKIGRAWGQLMAGLGYDCYVAQGGDWGSMVTHSIALTQPACLGIHTNMPLAFPQQPITADLSPFERAALDDMRRYQDLDSGYAKQQTTRPQTLGYGLADSPSGQLAWIIEKFWSWMDCGTGATRHPESILTKDELLDNVMMYWLTNSGASSARLYWESFADRERPVISKPVGCSIFPHEIFRPSRRWAEARYSNLIHFNVLDRGGHFAALEQPAIFVDEVRMCFRQLRAERA
jgi:pimeloyl-ACP methyl ester carboxylesterase